MRPADHVIDGPHRSPSAGRFVSCNYSARPPEIRSGACCEADSSAAPDRPVAGIAATNENCPMAHAATSHLPRAAANAMEAENSDETQEVFAQSRLSIDIEHKAALKECHLGSSLI